MNKILQTAEPMYDDTFTIYPEPLTQEELEEIIVFERLDRYNHGKPCGAQALLRHLQRIGVEQLPSAGKIRKILAKRFLTNGRTGYYPEDYR
jgi:hypothetical protein